MATRSGGSTIETTRAVDWVFYETAPGHRVYIYKGIQGDATSFDPEMALVDSTEGGNAYVLTRPAGGPCF